MFWSGNYKMSQTTSDFVFNQEKSIFPLKELLFLASLDAENLNAVKLNSPWQINKIISSIINVFIADFIFCRGLKQPSTAQGSAEM